MDNEKVIRKGLGNYNWTSFFKFIEDCDDKERTIWMEEEEIMEQELKEREEKDD